MSLKGGLGVERTLAYSERGAYCKRMKQAMIIISCFALENYLWMRKYGADPPSYELPEWVELNRVTPISGVRELISMVVWSGV